MIEKVNPMHPDKVADRIAGAMVDLAYKSQERPKVAVEVLIGHGKCHIIAETSVHFYIDELRKIVERVTGEKNIYVDYAEVPQDPNLASNQEESIKCGDNGIFKGMPLTKEQKRISRIVREIYKKYPTDGKFILTKDKFIACQSNADATELSDYIEGNAISGIDVVINPLGPWTGGTNVDTGATNRKLGSDMADAVTGGGLHGKDLSKADVAVNIYAHMLAQTTGHPVELSCAIGDTTVAGVPYCQIVEYAREFIEKLGGFEKLAEWGLF